MDSQHCIMKRYYHQKINYPMNIENGWLVGVEHIISPHFNQRPKAENIRLLVIHNISLPPGKFGGKYISDLFVGKLDPTADPSFESIYQLQVSAHCLIRRNGQVIQYVSFNDRAWHAGVSEYNQAQGCNDFSIGIELEGTDVIPYTDEQYQQLSRLTMTIKETYPSIDDNIVGHCDIAPVRKTDPGQAFDWSLFNDLLKKNTGT